jgi:transcriptional regulator with XRE-family HTH domain
MAKVKFPTKKEIGSRFKRFREALGKTQTQLAKELDVYQSTITNIEVGKTFPSIKYLHHFHRKYRLNANWLLSDRGEIFVPKEEDSPDTVSLLGCHLHRADQKFPKYSELIDLMQIPVVEQVILAKLVEIKVLAKDVIEEFLQSRKGNNSHWDA